MKKLSFKAIISVLLVLVLSFTVIYMPGLSVKVFAADCSNGHTFTKQDIDPKYLKSEATCGVKAVYYYSCDVCSASSEDTNEAKTFEYGTAPSHEWGPFVSYDATCTEDKLQKQTCSRCKQEYVRKTAGTALGHDYDLRSNSNGTHTKICRRAGCGDNLTENCSTANIVCGVVSVCDVCRASYGSAAEHDLSKETVTKKPTCSEAGEAVKTCSRCDYTEKTAVAATGHDYQLVSVITEVKCTTNGKEKVKCSDCSDEIERIVTAPGHKYKKTTVEATCRDDGYDQYICEACGDSYKDNYTPKGTHNYAEKVTPATCTTGGSTLFTCKTCGIFYTGNEVAALGHDMSGYVVTQEPTCTEAGLKVDKCSRCSRTITETIPANGHELVDEVKAPTCLENGYTQHKCKNCNYVANDTFVEKLGHDKLLTNSVPATCTYYGINVYTCKRCNAEIREDVAPLGHEFDYKPDGNATCTADGTKTGKCIRCPETSTVKDEGSALKHSFTLYTSNDDATCTANATQWAVCDNGCGSKDVKEIPNSAKGHTPAAIDGADASCTETGLTKGEKCEVCNEIIKPQQTIPAKGHDYSTKIITAPTCSTAGTAEFECIVCGFKYTGEVPATGEHAWDKGTETVPATCDNEGVTTYKCADCSATETKTVNRLGHDWSSSFTVDVQETCYREGEKSRHCSRCEGRQDVTKIPMVDHELGDYESNGDATCELDGSKSKKCKFCTYKSAPVQDVGSALGHSYTNYVSDGNVTCTVDGTKTASCDNGCGMTDVDIEKSTGHDYEVNAAKAPTCTEPGLTEGKTCTKCGDTLIAQEVIDPTGHNEAIKEAKAPTCTQTGLTEGVYCITCKEDIVPQTKIAKLGHSYTKVVTKATTSSNGKIRCTNCGDNNTLYKVTSFKLATSAFYYNGEPQVPEKAVVKDSKGNTLKEGTDYEIVYSGSISAKPGTYKVKIKLIGKYSGSKNVSFKIIPAKITTIKTTNSTTAVKLTWNKAAGASGYRVYQYNTSKKKWVTLKSATTSRSFKITGLTAGKTYIFAVKPYYKSGDTVVWGNYTQWETATRPSTPKVTGTAGSKSATLSWKQISGATGYVVYYSTSKDGKYTKLAATKKLTYTASKLTGLKTYYFKVRAYRKTANGNVYSAYTSPIAVRTKL